jgi:hypothetical protein
VVRCQCTLYSSTNTHLHSTDSLPCPKTELWWLARACRYRLNARRLLDPYGAQWDRWKLAVQNPLTGTYIDVAVGSPMATLWKSATRFDQLVGHGQK